MILAELFFPMYTMAANILNRFALCPTRGKAYRVDPHEFFLILAAISFSSTWTSGPETREDQKKSADNQTTMAAECGRSGGSHRPVNRRL